MLVDYVKKISNFDGMNVLHSIICCLVMHILWSTEP